MGNRRAALVPRKHGLITTRAALAAGLDHREITQLLRSGVWIAVRTGVYVDAEQWTAADEWRGQPLIRARAAHLSLEGEHVFSHDSAALAHGLPVLPDPDRLAHVTRKGVTGSRRRHGIMQHGAPYEAKDVTEIDGIPVMSIARTAIDIAREHGYTAGLVTCDAAVRRGVPRGALGEVVTGMSGWPGTRAAQAAVRDADPGAETAGETLARELVQELQIGPVTTQFPVLISTGTTAWVDMLVGCHAFEFDGRIKYRSVSDGGVAERPAEEVVWEERKRERLIRTEGLGMSRITWADHYGPARQTALKRLAAEYALTVKTHGTALPPALAAYAVQMAGERERRLRQVGA